MTTERGDMTNPDGQHPPLHRRTLLGYAAAGAGGLALPVTATSAAVADTRNGAAVESVEAEATLEGAALHRHLRRLYRRALDEGGKLVIWAGGDSPTQEDATKAAFEEAFPGTDVTIKVDLSKYHAPRIDRRLALGEGLPDIAQLQTLHDFDHWKHQGVLLPYKPSGWRQVYQPYKDPDGAYVGISVLSFGRISNTNLIPNQQAPRDASDFLAPRFRDQLIFTYPNDDDAVLYAFYLVVAKYGLEYLERLMRQNPQFVRGGPPVLGAVASGQKLASFAGIAPLQPIPGLPVRYSVPLNRPVHVLAADRRHLPARPPPARGEAVPDLAAHPPTPGRVLPVARPTRRRPTHRLEPDHRLQHPDARLPPLHARPRQGRTLPRRRRNLRWTRPRAVAARRLMAPGSGTSPHHR